LNNISFGTENDKFGKEKILFASRRTFPFTKTIKTMSELIKFMDGIV